MTRLAKGRSNGNATATSLFQHYPFISAVDIPLGETRGHIHVHIDGDVEFHLVHTPDEELYPGQDDGIRFTALDAPIFRFILQVLDAARDIADQQAETLLNAGAEEVQEKKPPLIVAGDRATEDLNRFALR